jgi:hypothetical protein
MIEEGSVILVAKTMIRKNRPSTRDFVAMFGVTARVCAVVWNITSFDNDIKLVHLLWALMFLKMYEKEAILSAIAGVDRKTYRDKVWRVLSGLQAKASSVVSTKTKDRSNQFLSHPHSHPHSLTTC